VVDDPLLHCGKLTQQHLIDSWLKTNGTIFGEKELVPETRKK